MKDLPQLQVHCPASLVEGRLRNAPKIMGIGAVEGLNPSLLSVTASDSTEENPEKFPSKKNKLWVPGKARWQKTMENVVYLRCIAIV